MTSGPHVRVLIADDHNLFLEALALNLELEPRVELVGQARNGKDAVRLAFELEPDVVLMDLRMPLLDGFAATRTVTSALPECRVVVLTASLEAANADRAREAGAAAYLTKDCSMRDMVEALLDVARPADHAGKEERGDARGWRASRAAGRSLIPPLRLNAQSA